jgi:sulfur relay (sulfurtransferase) complex TusBCD TusD component (DsrE family)
MAHMAIAQTNKCQGPGCDQIGKCRKITDNLKGQGLEICLCETCWSRLP